MPDFLVALRVLVSLAAVLGLLWWLSRRLQKGQAAGGSPFAGLVPKKLTALGQMLPKKPQGSRAQPERITVVARAGLGGKAQMVVAEFGGIRYVLGVTESGVSVMDTQEAPLQDEEESATEKASFELIEDVESVAEEPANVPAEEQGAELKNVA